MLCDFILAQTYVIWPLLSDSDVFRLSSDSIWNTLSSPCTVPVTLSLSLSLSARGCGLYVHCLYPCVLRKHQSLSSFVRPSVVPSFRFPVQRPSFVSNNLESTQPHYSILNLRFPPHSLRCSRTKTMEQSARASASIRDTHNLQKTIKAIFVFWLGCGT